MSAARKILETYWDGVIPVKPVALGQSLRVQVFKQILDPGQSGLIMLDGDTKGRARIIINAEDDLIRQRFAISHMLGHLALGHLASGKAERVEPAKHFLLDELSKEEVEANHFALELLMPRDALEVAFRAGHTRISSLAKVFVVSEVAIVERLKTLNWISSYDCFPAQPLHSKGKGRTSQYVKHA